MNPRIALWYIVFILALNGLQSVRSEVEVFGASPPVFQIVEASETSPAFQEVLAGVNPWGLAFHPNSGVVYFSDPTAGVIGFIDPAAEPPVINELINRPGAVFRGIALDEEGNRLFFLDSSNNSINVVDLGTLMEAALLIDANPTQRPNELVYDPIRRWLSFTDSGSEFIGITDDTGEIITGVFGADIEGCWGMALHPKTGDLYFSSFTQGTIVRLDPETLARTPVANNLDGPRGLKFDRFDRLFCLESGTGEVVQIPLSGQSSTVSPFTGVVNGRAFLVFDGDDTDGDFILDDWERGFTGGSLLTLGAGGDADGDGCSDFEEFLFNTSPVSGADSEKVRTLSALPGGGLTASFEGPEKGHEFEAYLSSDLETWVLWPGGLSETLIGEDPIYSSWQLSVEDPAALGLDPDRLFVRFDGETSQP